MIKISHELCCWGSRWKGKGTRVYVRIAVRRSIFASAKLSSPPLHAAGAIRSLFSQSCGEDLGLGWGALKSNRVPPEGRLINLIKQ